ncbi:hypothetical protein [Micromonospora chalcea]|uniref:hypothetical protein n=1 Tax=Micromonospora chalcea TaxID=1874 RepID=UPI0038F5DC3E
MESMDDPAVVRQVGSVGLETVPAARVAEALADKLMDLAAEAIAVGHRILIHDVAYEEGDTEFGIQLTNGQVFGVKVHAFPRALGILYRRHSI